MTPIDIFISHATKDDAAVKQIEAALQAAGLHVWADHHQLKSGGAFDPQIQAALNDCRAGLLVLSTHSAQSPECNAEWRRVLALKKTLYVARLEAVPLELEPYRLSIIQRIDLHSDFAAGLQMLVTALTDRAPDPSDAAPYLSARLTGPFRYAQLGLALTGRDEELIAVRRRLTAGRTLTITGFGGVGKTRLAAEVALRLAPPDGIIWHEIQAESTLATLAGLVRDHFSLPATTRDDQAWQHLAASHALLVLDNAEECRSPHAYSDRLNRLDQTHGLRILLTNRTEWEDLELADTYPLRVPDLPNATALLRQMLGSEVPDQSFTDAEASDLAEATHRLPRLMLFAAGWLKTFPLRKVLQMLQTWQGASPEKALQAVVGRTVELLREQTGGEAALAALRKLAVCRGGFTYEAAEALLGSDTEPLLLLRAWHLLERDGNRYYPDPLAVQVVGEEASAYALHLEYYHDLFYQHNEKQEYLGLDPESANLEVAFERALKSPTPELAYLLANTSFNFLDNRGRYRQCLSWLEQVREALSSSTEEVRALLDISLGTAYWTAAQLEDQQNNLHRAIEAFSRALRFRSPATEPLHHATTQHNLGLVYQDLSRLNDKEANLHRSITAYRRSLRVYSAVTNPLDYATAQNNLGNAYWSLSQVRDRTVNLHRAIEFYHTALLIRTPSNAPLHYAMTQGNLGNAYSDLAAFENREENFHLSITAYHEALRFWTPDTAPLQYAVTQKNLSVVYDELGVLPAAVACWQNAEPLFRRMGDIANANLMLTWIAKAQALQGG